MISTLRRSETRERIQTLFFHQHNDGISHAHLKCVNVDEPKRTSFVINVIVKTRQTTVAILYSVEARPSIDKIHWKKKEKKTEAKKTSHMCEETRLFLVQFFCLKQRAFTQKNFKLF